MSTATGTNCFRLADGSLDRKYLRTCAVGKMLRQGRITKHRALDLLIERHGANSNIRSTWEIMCRHLKL